jgi:hypothetical protein
MARNPFAFAVLALFFALGLARAQDSAPIDDPPDRAARLSLIEGDVSIQPAGETAWAPAQLNRPLTTGDQLWTEDDARAEIHVGRAAVRLDNNTNFSFTQLDDDTIRMQVDEGVMSLSIRALNESERLRIETPNVALDIVHPGNYRVEVNGAGDGTVVKVIEGEVKATGASQDFVVYANEVATFTGVERLAMSKDALGEMDDFDAWTLDRDRRDYLALSSRTAEYVSPDVTGYQDLDEYGTWSTESEYGHVWTPTYVNPGWAPYSYGQWAWVSPWGWTWIDSSPWGYAPFHYGRWAYVRSRWCWVPGPRAVRAVYAPALVGWNRSRHGYVSWFPLGPRDLYMPDGRYSRRYLERVNVTNSMLVHRAVQDVNAHRGRHGSYHNRAIPGAVTTVTRAAFTGAERVDGRRLRTDDRQLANDIAGSPATTTAPRIPPVRESRLGAPPREHRPSPLAVAAREVNARRNAPATRTSPTAAPAPGAFAPNPGSAPKPDPRNRVVQPVTPNRYSTESNDVLRRVREQQAQRDAEAVQQRREREATQLRQQYEHRAEQQREQYQQREQQQREQQQRQFQQREQQQQRQQEASWRASAREVQQRQQEHRQQETRQQSQPSPRQYEPPTQRQSPPPQQQRAPDRSGSAPAPRPTQSAPQNRQNHGRTHRD